MRTLYAGYAGWRSVVNSEADKKLRSSTGANIPVSYCSNDCWLALATAAMPSRLRKGLNHIVFASGLVEEAYLHPDCRQASIDC